MEETECSEKRLHQYLCTSFTTELSGLIPIKVNVYRAKYKAIITSSQGCCKGEFRNMESSEHQCLWSPMLAAEMKSGWFMGLHGAPAVTPTQLSDPTACSHQLSTAGIYQNLAKLQDSGQHSSSCLSSLMEDEGWGDTENIQWGNVVWDADMLVKAWEDWLFSLATQGKKLWHLRSLSSLVISI